MYLPYLPRVKDQGRTKDKPRMNQRTPNQEKCFLLRLPSLLSLLYLPLFYRPTTERTPTELRLNSPPTKSTFLKIGFLKRLTRLLKRLTLFLKWLTFPFLNKNRPKITLFLHISKKKCIFAANFIIMRH